MATYAVLASRRFARSMAVGVFLGTIQPAIISFSSSYYFLFALRVLPAAILWWGLQRGTRNWRLFALITSANLVVFLSGYEYFTVCIAMQLGVLAYVAASRALQHSRTTVILGVLSAGVICAFICAQLVHVAQLTHKFGSVRTALVVLRETISKRTGLGTSTDSNTLIIESLNSDLDEVLDWYLAMPVIGAPTRIPILGLFTVAVLIGCLIGLAVSSFLGFSPIQDRARWRGLILAWSISALGPIGWHVLFRPHSYIHTHINGVMWFFPTIPLGLGLLSMVSRAFLHRHIRDQ